MDQDGDWKLSFPEFLEQAHDILKNYVDFETAGAHVPTAEENFAMLDVDNDKYACLELKTSSLKLSVIVNVGNINIIETWSFLIAHLLDRTNKTGSWKCSAPPNDTSHFQNK